MDQTVFIFICMIFAVSSAYAGTFEFEFGSNRGEVIHSAEGTILPFIYETRKYIPVPPGMKLTYIKVIVNSLSPPKVDFDSTSNNVAIRFSMTQITLSTYSIVSKAIRIQN